MVWLACLIYPGVELTDIDLPDLPSQFLNWPTPESSVSALADQALADQRAALDEIKLKKSETRVLSVTLPEQYPIEMLLLSWRLNRAIENPS